MHCRLHLSWELHTAGFNTEIAHIGIQTSDIIADLSTVQKLFESYTHWMEFWKKQNNNNKKPEARLSYA